MKIVSSLVISRSRQLLPLAVEISHPCDFTLKAGGLPPVDGPDPASRNYIVPQRTSKTSILSPCLPFNTSMQIAVRIIRVFFVGTHPFILHSLGMSISNLGTDFHNLDRKWISPCHESAGSHLLERPGPS